MVKNSFLYSLESPSGAWQHSGGIGDHEVSYMARRRLLRFLRGKLLVVVVLGLPTILLPASISLASQVVQEEPTAAGGNGNLGYIGAGIAVVGSTIAAGIALYGVAVGGSALLAERPDMFTAVIVLGGLAEGVAIYGFLIGYLILGKI